MKKILMTVALMVVAVAASAQIYVGGSFELSSNTPAHHKDDDVDAATTFSIMPEIGYNLDDKWTIGLGIGYEHGANQFVSPVVGSGRTWDAVNSFTIQPYVRYHFVKWNNVSLYVQGGIGYTTTKLTYDEDNGDGTTTSFDSKASTFYIAFTPGVKVDLTKKLFFVASVGSLGWSTTNPDVDDYEASSTVGLSIDLTRINFGMYYNF